MNGATLSISTTRAPLPCGNSCAKMQPIGVREFHFDGLRLDATQQIFDASPRNIIAELTAAARGAAGGRSVLVIAENEPQEARLVRPEPRGYGVDGVWNEDLHHAAHVTLTARCEAYYSDYTGSARELLACVKHGFLYQGQRSTWQNKKPRAAVQVPSRVKVPTCIS